MALELEIIGRVETCYDEKFGVPRQPRLVKSAWGRVVFKPAFQNADLVKGIEGFSHLWLIFQFHLNPATSKATVRPPRLGGNERRGVFATRSSFRPNPIGMSVVELEKVEHLENGGVVLHVLGADLVNGTPLLDIKPYIPFCDSIENAVGGFVDGEPEKLAVEWHCEIPFSEQTKRIVEESLAVDPRPAYHEGSREYGCTIEGWNVRWLVEEDKICVVSVCQMSNK